MKSLRLLALTSCVAALSACNTVDGLVEDLRFTDWGAFNGKAGGKSENFLSDGCPQAAVVPELANFAEFTDNARPTTGSMVSHVTSGGWS